MNIVLVFMLLANLIVLSTAPTVFWVMKRRILFFIFLINSHEKADYQPMIPKCTKGFGATSSYEEGRKIMKL